MKRCGTKSELCGNLKDKRLNPGKPFKQKFLAQPHGITSLAICLPLVVVFVTFIPAAAAATPAPTLPTYLVQVKPHAVAFRLHMRQTLSAIRNDLNYTKIRQAGVRLTVTSTKLGKVKAPAALSEAHGSFVRGVRICGRALVRYVDEYRAGVKESRALGRFSGALDTGGPLIDHWREEMLVQLRHAGLPVPLWVKNVGF